MNNKLTNNKQVLTAKRTTLSTLVCLAIACSGSALADPYSINPYTVDRGYQLDSTTPQGYTGTGGVRGSETSNYKKPAERPTARGVHVNSFSFVGNSVFSDSVLLEKLRQYQNTNLTLDDLNNAAREITKLYRENGYIVARAYVPAQSSDNGVVRISILEGVIGDVNLNNNSQIRDDVVVSYARGSRDQRNILSDKIERKALLLNDLSGVKDVEINAAAGRNFGESDLHIKVYDDKKYGGQISVDNHGTKYAGKHRATAIFDVNNLTGVGDKFTFAGLISQNADSKSFSANYVRPIGYDGWKVGGSIYKTDYELSKIGHFVSDGESTGVSAWASYPFVKKQDWVSEVKFGGYTQDMKDRIGLSYSGLKYKEQAKKKNTAMSIEFNNNLSTSFFNSPGRLYNSIKYTGGNLSNKNAIAKNNNRYNKISGNWSKVEMLTIHRQKLSDNFSLLSSLNIQENLGKNLDSTEKAMMGGPNGVRAYLNSELNADSGYVASLDLIYNLPSNGAFNHNVSVFVDRAEGKKNSKRIDKGLKNKRTLNAAGVGYKFAVNNTFDIDATYARGFGSDSRPEVQSEFSTSKNRFYVKGTYKF